MDDDQITEVILLNEHKKQLEKGTTNDEHTLELITMLGGIDLVLAKLLEMSIPPNKSFELSSLQLKNVYDIITHSSGESATRMQKIKQTTTNAEDHDTFYYELDSNDTLLHSIMEERNAQAVINILHHRLVYFVIILSGIIWAVLATPLFTQLKYPLYIIAMSVFLWIPYCVCMLFMMNRKAAKMVTFNFEFWLKAVYGFVYFVATFVDLYGLQLDQLKEGNSIFEFWGGIENDIRVMMGADILFLGVVIPLLIIVVSFWDAFYGIRYWKIGVSSFLALQFTIFSIWLQFVSYTQTDRYQLTVSGLSFPVLSLRIISLRILAIFLWKQAIVALFRKNTSISIRINPYLVWKAGPVYYSGDASDEDGHVSDQSDSEMNIPAINPNSVNNGFSLPKAFSISPVVSREKNDGMQEAIQAVMDK